MTLTHPQPQLPLARPIGWPFCTMILLPAASVVWLGVSPGFYYMWNIAYLVYLWWGAVFFFLVRTLIRSWLLEWEGVPDTERHVDYRRGAFLGLVLLVATVLIIFKVPLRVGFLIARPQLTQLIKNAKAGQSPVLQTDTWCGFYLISASATSKRRGCHVPGRVILMLASDPEAGFVYSPNGVDALCYNDGSKGHLIGHWYWMAED